MGTTQLVRVLVSKPKEDTPMATSLLVAVVLSCSMVDSMCHKIECLLMAVSSKMKIVFVVMEPQVQSTARMKTL